MNDVIIYHNPRCVTSKKALAILEEAGVQPEVIKYLETPPTAEELADLLDKLGFEGPELLRKRESLYKELGLGAKSLTREEAIRLIVEHPVLIERPIVVAGDRAVLGRPPERVKELLGE